MEIRENPGNQATRKRTWVFPYNVGMTGKGWTFVSIATWPTGWDVAQRQKALVAAGMQGPDAAVVAKRASPMVVRRLESAAGEKMIQALERQGVHAFGLSNQEWDRAVEATPAKTLRAAIGAPKPMYQVEAWRPRVFSDVTLVMEQVFLIIRATVMKQETQTTVEPAGGPFGGHSLGFGDPGYMLAHSAGGALGGLAYEAAKDPEDRVAKSSNTRVHGDHVIEMYMMDGSRVRINSAKFNFEVLGDQKGITDRENMDMLMLRLSEEATHAIIDFGFESFRPPHNLTATTTSSWGANTTVKTVDPWPAFEFYSVWRYVMARREAGLM